MTRYELAVAVGVILAAIGIGLWVHPGAGLLLAGLALAIYGALELAYPPPEPEQPAATS